MQRILKFTRFLSILVFLGVLLFVYAYLPEQVGIDADERNEFSAFIGKEYFFYLSMAIFLLVNIIFVVFANLLQMLRVSASGFFKSEDFKESIHSWFVSFGVVINLFLISVVAFIGFFNNADYYNISSFSAFAYIGQGLIFIWIVLFFYLLIRRK